MSQTKPKRPRCKGFMCHVWVEFRGKIACNRCLKPRNPRTKPLTKKGATT